MAINLGRLTVAVIASVAFGCAASTTAPISAPSLNVPVPRSVVINCYFDNTELPPRAFELNQRQANQVANCLDSLDWTSTTSRLAEISLIHPDVSIILTDTSGVEHTFQFYWSGDSFLDQQQGLLLTSTDLSGLRRVVASVTGLSSAPIPN